MSTATQRRRRLPKPKGAPDIDRSIPLHERRKVVQNPHHRDSFRAPSLEAEDDSGIIRGLANTFLDTYDCYNSRFIPGCFKRSIDMHNERRKAGKHSHIKILLQHNRYEPIGVALELEERKEGLYSVGKIAGAKRNGLGADTLDKIVDGVLDGLSIGFREVEGGTVYLDEDEYEANGFDPDDWWTFWFPPRDYVDVDTNEYSPVTFPAHFDARIESVVRSFAPQWSGWRAPLGEARTAYNQSLGTDPTDSELAELRKQRDRIDAVLTRFEERTDSASPDPKNHTEDEDEALAEAFADLA